MGNKQIQASKQARHPPPTTHHRNGRNAEDSYWLFVKQTNIVNRWQVNIACPLRYAQHVLWDNAFQLSALSPRASSWTGASFFTTRLETMALGFLAPSLATQTIAVDIAVTTTAILNIRVSLVRYVQWCTQNETNMQTTTNIAGKCCRYILRQSRTDSFYDIRVCRQ